MPTIIDRYNHLELLFRALRVETPYQAVFEIYDFNKNDGTLTVAPQEWGDGFVANYIKRNGKVIDTLHNLTNSPARDMKHLMIVTAGGYEKIGMERYLETNSANMSKSDISHINRNGTNTRVLTVDKKVVIHNADLLESPSEIEEFCKAQGLDFKRLG